MNKFIISLSLSALTSLSALAEHECKQIDLRDNNQLGMVRDQGSLGWCFAYVAADMYSMALGTRVSPFDIAVNYYRHNSGYRPGIYGKGSTKISTFDGGRQDWVLDSSQDWGLCPDKVFSGYVSGNAGALKKIDNLADEVNKLSGSERRAVLTKKLNAMYTSIYRVFPMTSSAALRDAIEDSNRGEYPLVEIADNICDGKRIDVKALNRRTIVPAERGEMTPVNFINKHLAKRRPIAVGYNSKILKDPKNRSGMSHISTIVGSRKINGKCEYLLRNSWGSPTANSYHKDLWSKKDGDYIWLPEQLVRDMADELTAIFKGKE